MARLPAVSEYMDTVVHTMREDQDLLSATDFLIEHHVTGAPVVDDAGHVIGILTERDCLKLLTLGTADADAPIGRVGDYMQRKVVTIAPEMNIYYAAGLFLHHNFRRLPVVKDGKLVGAITRFDILKAVSANHKLVSGSN